MKVCPNCDSVFEYDNDNSVCPKCKIIAKDIKSVVILRVVYYKSGIEKTYYFDIPCKWEIDGLNITYSDSNKSLVLNIDECSIKREIYKEGAV